MCQTSSPDLDPRQQRLFAVDAVKSLTKGGFEAYWAGGCVRDQLLGRPPKDYDVATNATPDEICHVFRRRRTLRIGAAFGVITVLGPRAAGQIEVATFRRDAQYSDGRHPDHVTFSSAAEDASRRDFTINGMFFDPIHERVIDFVGGQEDLQRRVIRAIGEPRLRFAEDKLRMLRAVRFAAAFDFTLDADTLAAIREMAGEINVVSPERIAMELRRMLPEPRRDTAVRLLVETGLAAAVLPEIVPTDGPSRDRLERQLTILARLAAPGFPLTLAALLHGLIDAARAREVCLRWKLSNKETDETAWLVEHHADLAAARAMPWSALQPLLIAEGIEDLLSLAEAKAPDDRDEVVHCRRLLQQPRAVLDPPPLLSGNDLLDHGVPSGPIYTELLRRVRRDQLDGHIQSKADALALVDRLLGDEAGGLGSR